MRHGSLFSGIGGFDLAAQWMGWENVFQVEKDEFCQQVLAKNFPNTARYGDIKEFDGKEFRGSIDILTGGFPCQPFSVAGEQKGKKDERYLWPETDRVIEEIGAAIVVLENVPGIINISLDEIIFSLESKNYTTETFCLPACAVGAPHRRDRIWIIAYSERCEWREKSHSWKAGRMGRQQQSFPWDRHWEEALREFRRVDDGLSYRVDRIDTIRNAIVPQVAFEIFKAIEATINYEGAT